MRVLGIDPGLAHVGFGVIDFNNNKLQKINDNLYKIFPVYYPIGNGIFNIDKSIEDINWIISKYIK